MSLHILFPPSLKHSVISKEKQIVAERATGGSYPGLSSDALGKKKDQKDELRSWLCIYKAG